MKKILFALTMIFALAVFASEAWAIFGAPDDVPGNKVLFFMVANDEGMDTVFNAVNISSETLLCRFGVIRGRNATTMLSEWQAEMPARGSISGSFAAFLAGLTPSQKEELKVTVGGRTFYTAIISIQAAQENGDPSMGPSSNKLLGWVYVVDLLKGFSAGFNMVSFEELGDYPMVEVDMPSKAPDLSVDYAFTASTLYLRYLVWNDKPQTYNLIFLLMGLEGLSFTGEACSEQGVCAPINLPQGNRLTVLDVEEILPPQLKGAYPWVGHIKVWPNDPSLTYLGWSYQRVESDDLNPGLSWSAIHPAFRRY